MTQPSVKEKLASRKFGLMLLIFIFSTASLIFPTILSLITGIQLGAVITGGEYVSLMIGTLAIYSSANVVQKKLEQARPPPSTNIMDD